MQPTSSYITRTSTPSAAFLRRMSRMAFHMCPMSMMKNSRKMKRSAFFSSASMEANMYSPTGKYSADVSFQAGMPTTEYRYWQLRRWIG